MVASLSPVKVLCGQALTILATISKDTGSSGSTGTIGAFTLRMGFDHPDYYCGGGSRMTSLDVHRSRKQYF
jgi:hypothetical protein